MSFSASPYLIKLQDLKLWQNNYDHLLKTKNDTTRQSDYDTIEGISALDSPDLTPQISPRGVLEDWDKKVLTPVRPFEQLLEEKLAEDQPVIVQAKVKKPFLRKGTGLLRYNLGPRPPIKRRTRRGSNSAPNGSENGSFQHSVDVDKDSQQMITPLKIPEMSMKSKPTWVRADNEESNSNYMIQKPDSGHRDVSSIIGRINELTLKKFIPSSPKSIVQSGDNCGSKNNFQSLNTTEKELKLFEALEERAENTSFSSTNSSIMRILSSTPNKNDKPQKSPKQEESSRDFGAIQNTKLAEKLKEVNAKSDVLSNFLHNLRKISENNCKQKTGKENCVSSSDTSYSEEEEKSSTNTDTRTQSPSSFYTDFENTFRNNTKVDAAVNTSNLEEQQSIGCLNCKELRKSLDKLRKEVPDIQAEKARVCDFAKDLEKKRDQLSREIEKLRKKYDKDLGDLQEELEIEKKKFVREKSIFDMYMKDSHNRPTKKEREEISGLKKELVDAKELLKLKDAKNGATQARLRNQIKQLEKERSELKTAVDNLQKENSKLSAQQKVRRPAESKLLQEINRNLTKLTEESLKGHLNKSDSVGDKKGSVDDVDKGRRKSTGDASRKLDREVISPKLNRKPLPTFKKRLSEDREPTMESLEKQYETTFGQLAEPAGQISMNESKEGTKTTKVYPDGSKEIKYSNGSWKTVSPDGQLIIFKYYNGDIKETNMKEGTVKYYFAESSAWNTEFPDGSELVEYANGQKERKYKDGKIEVICSDGRLLTRFPDGSDEMTYPDGSKILHTAKGEKIVEFPNGQKEFHTEDHKRREYPDGTVKFIYADGTRETRYSNGRVRIKDCNNVLILDSQPS